MTRPFDCLKQHPTPQRHHPPIPRPPRPQGEDQLQTRMGQDPGRPKIQSQRHRERETRSAITAISVFG
jgi:hypothetical protein